MKPSRTLSQEIERGSRAKAIIEDELWVEAWEVMDSELMRVWESSQAHESVEREKIWMLVKQTKRLRSYFENVIETGKLALIEAGLNREQKEQSE